VTLPSELVQLRVYVWLCLQGFTELAKKKFNGQNAQQETERIHGCLEKRGVMLIDMVRQKNPLKKIQFPFTWLLLIVAKNIFTWKIYQLRKKPVIERLL